MVTPAEAYGIKIASDPEIHGEFVYFTLNWIEGEEYASSIYRYNGRVLDRVTFGNHEKGPKFRGDSLYYISYSKENERLVCIDGTKEPRDIFTGKSISKFIFHGDSILAVTADRADDREPFATGRIKYRYDSRGLLRKKNKLIFVKEKPETLAEGDFDVNDVESNGTRIIFSATKEMDDYDLNDIYDLDVETKKYTRITEGQGVVNAMCVTQEGRIAYTGNRKGLDSWARDSLLFPESGETVDIAQTTGNDVGSDMFVSDNLHLLHEEGKFFMVGQNGGSTSVYSFNGKEEKLTPDGISVRDFAYRNGKLAYIYSSPEKPSVISFNGEYDFNPEIHGKVPERIEVDGREAWLILSGKDRPTVLSVHGGPHGTYGYAYFIEFNYLAENGFNVLFGNPRGSSGYGEDFAKQCVGDWGGRDFEDLLEFLDTATTKFSLSDKAAITGGSYGGFMTNAAITKTARFRCGVSERSISNMLSMCGTSDIGFWFNALENGVEDPWSPEGMKRLNEISPLTHVKEVRTPTMFIHGEEDYRCPIEQSEQMYTALRMNGIDSMLVRYQGDSHEHARRGIPANMRDRLERKLGWFRKYCSE